ncbi:MAG: hypothetical protein JOZ57_02665, partial [Abitibacteriaceae bacterium]|nr:hypothetical protein [Abditibacteriaceae bacterium]
MYIGCAILLSTQWILPVAAISPTSAQTPSVIEGTQSSGLRDTIDVTSTSSISAHQFARSGTVTRTLVGDQVGGHNMRRLAHVVTGQDSWVSYAIKVQPGQPTTVELEEMYGRNRDVNGYLVLADDAKVYLRTWQGCGAGPIHYFVQLPATNKRFVTLKLVNQLDTPFSISRIWAFSDFQRYFKGSHMAVPYYLAPTAWLSYTDYAADLAKLRQIKTSLGNHPHAKPAWTTWIPYAGLNDRDVAARIDYIFRLARDLDMPVQISCDTWWANTPGGADGKDGYWTDVEYQQVVYNATKKQFQLSVPNQWSNTPWLTVNHPTLNAFKAQRIRAAMSHLQKRYRELCAEGRQRLLLALNLDNEPVYWASGNAGLGSDLLLADFNSHTIEAAQRDGVTLDPTNGL